MKAPVQRRTPKYYDGIESPTKEIKNLLPQVMKDIEGAYAKKSIHVIKAWPEIIGEKLAPMTQVVSFKDGILTVVVKSSTLYSLLCQHEKERILQLLQKRFSKEIVRKVLFRMG
jgi:predicted nucleic acid-binding Zn ribbon protein